MARHNNANAQTIGEHMMNQDKMHMGMKQDMPKGNPMGKMEKKMDKKMAMGEAKKRG